ncbi:A24 family peptidase [Streptococcus sp. sy010]|uniref:prepilin peptidase n=1 Tax=Streptococcus sp. sy010 TaxID=2600148 RepID=UPI0011B7950F|nr:A24 family peptidase [Streptococcus sp. sy010]TWT16547.1 prepilin peptidase [Streptococcus sp. sy010]
MKTILIFFLGASLGSFLGLVFDRFPEKSILFPRSHCNHCKKILTVRDLIPIFSQLINGSCCRFCHAKFPLWYAGLELTSGLVALACYTDIISPTQTILIYLGLILTLYDLKEQAYPLCIWLIGTNLLFFFHPINQISLFFLFLALLATFLPLKIGNGDFLFLASLSFSLNLYQLLYLLQLASILGITYSLSRKNQQDSIAFVPFLFLAYLVVLWLS